MVQALPIRNIIGNVKKSMTIYYSYLFQHDGNTILQYFLWKYSNMFNEKFKYTFSMVGCCGSGTSAPTLATDLKPGQVQYLFEAGSGTIFIWSRVRYNIYPGTAVQYVQHGRLCSRYIFIKSNFKETQQAETLTGWHTYSRAYLICFANFAIFGVRQKVWDWESK